MGSGWGLQSGHQLSLESRKASSVYPIPLSCLPSSFPPFPPSFLLPSIPTLPASLPFSSILSFPHPSLPPSLPLVHLLFTPLPLSPLLSHLPSHLTPGKLRSPQQMSRASPFRIRVQKMRHTRFFLLTFCFQHPKIVLVPLVPSICHPSLGDSCVAQGQSQSQLWWLCPGFSEGMSSHGARGWLCTTGGCSGFRGQPEVPGVAAHPGHSDVTACPRSLGAGAKGIECSCAAFSKADRGRFLLAALSPGLPQQDGSRVLWGV